MVKKRLTAQSTAMAQTANGTVRLSFSIKVYSWLASGTVT